MQRKRWLLLTLCFLLIDQATKALLKTSDQVLIPGVLALQGTSNTGAAFSLLASKPLLIAVMSVLLIALLFVFARGMLHRPLMALALAMVLGGAAGNLLDRLLYGHVVDFIKLLFLSFPIFNVADILITVGAGLAAISILFTPGEKA